MKIRLVTLLLVFIALIISKCAIIPPPSVSYLGPKVRIGIAENLESLAFKTNDMIDIWDQNGQLIAENVQGERWLVKLEDATAVNLKYRLLYRQVNDREVADRLLTLIEDHGQAGVIKPIKSKMLRGREWGVDYLYQILLKPIFDTENEAEQYQKYLADQFSTTVLPFFDSRPKGKVVLLSEDTGDRFQSPGLIEVRGDLFAFKVSAGEGYHFEEKVERIYRGELEFWIDRSGKLTVVNELPLEVYLKGVVGSEMHPNFPLEALKAQAVTARSYTLARIGNQHRLSPFDFCDEVHCHVYGGVDRESPQVNEAVDRTRGQVLMYNDHICDTYYAGVCGGHLENNEHVWSGESQPYLRGHLDSERRDSFPDNYLMDESHVRQWIESSPNVLCNTTRKSVPEYLEYTRKYFRWTVQYSGSELTHIVINKTGQDIGSLSEIIPVERGVSGRLKKIMLRGTKKTVTIEKELEIRRVLSLNYLYSSCFIVDRAGNDFVLKGAGWGHGVGMCQTGAAMMALEGFDYSAILDHYYKNSKLSKWY